MSRNEPIRNPLHPREKMAILDEAYQCWITQHRLTKIVIRRLYELNPTSWVDRALGELFAYQNDSGTSWDDLGNTSGRFHKPRHTLHDFKGFNRLRHKVDQEIQDIRAGLGPARWHNSMKEQHG